MKESYKTHCNEKQYEWQQKTKERKNDEMSTFSKYTTWVKHLFK